MDPVSAIQTVMTVINVATKLYPEIIATAGNLKTFGTTLFQEFTGTTISQADQVTLEAKIDELSDQLQQPLSAAQPGDPDYVAPTKP